MQDNFNITPWLFLVPAAVIGLILYKVPAIPALLAGSIIGGIFAMLFQPELVYDLGTKNMEAPEKAAAMEGIGAVITNYKVIAQSMFGETSIVMAEAGDPLESLNKLTSTSGIAGMLNTIFLIVTAMAFGGIMQVTGMLDRITDAILSRVRSIGGLIASTVGTCLFFNTTASDQYLAIVVPGRMYAEAYRERGLKPENLSRTLEDSGTVTSALIPWNTCGAYHSAALGVMTGDYFMYAFFNLLSPITTLIYGYLGFKVTRYTDEEMEAIKADDAAQKASYTEA